MKNLLRFISALSALLAVCAADDLSAQTVTARIAGLESNEEYMSLLRDTEILQHREDSIVNLIESARSRFVEVEDRDGFADYIVGLEDNIFQIRTRKGFIADRINTIEQEWVLSRLSSVERTDVGEQTDTGVVRPVVVRRNLVDNDCLREELSAEDYAELRSAHGREISIVRAVDTLIAAYGRLKMLSLAYAAADDEIAADSIYTDYGACHRCLDSLSQSIADDWSHIVDSKSYAYGLVLEKHGRTDILDRMESEFAVMRQQSAGAEGMYISDALTRYCVGKPVLAGYERRFAEAMSLTAAVDSLAAADKSIPQYDYRLDRIDLVRRLFLDFQPVAFGRTSFYNANNPLPKLKVYDEGTIYRLLLGRFKTRQPMTLFKGVYPLYIDRDEEQMYCYYAGGYATRAEAERAKQQLSERGFRAPQICRWVDGEMTNLTLAAEEDPSAEPVTGIRYAVQIASPEALPREVVDIIAAEGEGKEISRAGDGEYVVGTYADRAVADRLAEMIGSADQRLGVEVMEIEVE